MSRKLTKERVTSLLSIMFLAFIYASTAQAANIITHQKHIVLDPGHGGIDAGLATPAGIQEQQVTLELAEMISLELPDTFQVSLTRHAAEQPMTTLAQRTVFANQIRADLFISIHLQQTRSKTPLIFYHDPPASPAGQMAQITAKLFNTRQNIQAQMLKTRTIPLEGLLMPGILIEPISISGLPGNPEDRKRILTPYAQTMAMAIQNFFSATD